jgi:N-acetylmuramoyl-L-alanine amidase
MALQVALHVRDWLVNGYKVEVKLTRGSDAFVELSDRAKMANELGADYFVSLHHNASGGEGFETFVFPGTRNGQTGQMQDTVHQEIMKSLEPNGVKDRGKKEANFSVLRETKMPALLIENLFVDSDKDAKLLKDPTFIDGLAKSIAIGIAQAMSLEEQYPPGTPDWKKEAVGWMFQEGLLTDPQWKRAIEEPLPLWADAIILKKLSDKMKKRLG